MKCLILVGGYGTRLRPLTLSTPKPLVPFCNMPIVEHQIAAAAAAGVDEVILAVGYQPEEMQSALSALSARYKVKITCSIETHPLGTAGPVRLAEAILLSDASEEFFVFNSDVICEFPLSSFLAFHRAHGGLGSLCVTRVADPSKYGVVVFDVSTGRVDRFVEKPSVFISDQINAGLYILSKAVISRIPVNQPAMFEKDVFPQLAAESLLYCFQLPGYWADIGQPKDYLNGLSMHLDSLANRPVTDAHTKVVTQEEAQAKGYRVIGNVVVDDTAVVGEGAVLGPDVTVGRECVIGKGARVKSSAIFEGSTVGQAAYVAGSIVGWKSRVGNFARVEPLTVLGEDVQIADEILVNGAFLLPHKSLKESVFEHGKVLM